MDIRRNYEHNTRLSLTGIARRSLTTNRITSADLFRWISRGRIYNFRARKDLQLRATMKVADAHSEEAMKGGQTVWGKSSYVIEMLHAKNRICSSCGRQAASDVLQSFSRLKLTNRPPLYFVRPSVNMHVVRYYYSWMMDFRIIKFWTLCVSIWRPTFA